MTWREAYYQRVKPVVGELFFDRRVACWGLSEWHLAAAALAQSGIVDQLWFDDDDPLEANDAQLRSLGQGALGQGRAAALEAHLRQHNGFEDSWRLERRPRTIESLRGALAQRPPQLLLANLDAESPELLRAAIDAGVPTILSAAPAGAVYEALQLSWHPRAEVDVDALLGTVEALAGLPTRDADSPSAHVEALERRSLGLGLARWLLAPERPKRPDLGEQLLEAGRVALLRGDGRWPWVARLGRPGRRVLELSVGAPPRFRAPASFVGGETLLVLGLGTASLFCGEAPMLAKRLVLLDCKDVSPANPVRQLFPTQTIGAPKGKALAELLARRIAPEARWERRELGAGLTALSAADRELIYGELFLSRRERGSRERFAAILDEVRPTLAVVAMGRSKDDNFLATAELRRRGIRHITPTAFPGVSHFKHIVTDGAEGPCYDCLQGHLAIDGGVGPTLSADERELFYGGTQPATLAETLPSAHSLLRLALDLALPSAARPPYLRAALADERSCFVGANRVERVEAGWLYGVDRPFSMVTYGMQDLVGSRASERCPCGRINVVSTARTAPE
ncbi:MAG: hypothetical protein CSA65_00780 [Proteobacteria bacterium]|nr:MAG: hypothetical protein CSB49_06280 [Pseudomonadota bacterium]PIE19828.1 MAG: hypothetical protein CSA65_00780 [Pseudomonadota bacterium]